MKVLSSRFIGCIALVAIASLALAQGGGGRGQRGGMRGGGFAQSPAQLLQRKDVQADLGLSSDQITKLEAIAEAERGQRQQGGGGGQGGQRRQGGGGGGQQLSDEERAKRQEEARARREAQKKEILTVISEAQYARVEEIGLQLQGNLAVMNPEMQKKLELNESQVQKLKDLQKSQQEANQALFEKVRNQEISREDVQAIMKKNSDIMKVEIGKVLTEAQTGKLKAMMGKPFKADEE